MTLVFRLRIYLFLMLTVSLASAGLSIWYDREASRHVERIHVAHSLYEAYLSLSNHTFQLFKQYGDALLIGDLDQGESERALIEAVRADIARIRLNIGREIDLVGRGEIHELELLSTIDVKVRQLTNEYEILAKRTAPQDVPADWERLSRVLDDGNGRGFMAMINDALADEAAEVRAERADMRAQLEAHETIALLSGALALLTAFAALSMVQNTVKLRLGALLTGMREFADGNVKRRVGLPGTDELAELGRNFDVMAERISTKQRRLADQNNLLEAAVAERTARLERLLNEARRNETTRRQMLSDVSHELRTPLTIIQGEADIALRMRDAQPDDYREALTRARDAASHTARLVDDLLFIARSSEDRARLKLESFDLVWVLEDVVAHWREPITLRLSAQSAEVRADELRVRQVLAILLQNAASYGGGRTELSLDPCPEGWRIAVGDEGPGMTDEEKALAFERFFRGSNAAQRYGEGVGLGLPVALSIVEAHGGSMALSDRDGGGLVASLVLPRQPKLRAVS
ncbi:MAG: ATP-binding protein [Pseudomonadota bacterium]